MFSFFGQVRSIKNVMRLEGAMVIPNSAVLQSFLQKSQDEKQAIIFILRYFLTAKELKLRLSRLEKLERKA